MAKIMGLTRARSAAATENKHGAEVKGCSHHSKWIVHRVACLLADAFGVNCVDWVGGWERGATPKLDLPPDD